MRKSLEVSILFLMLASLTGCGGGGGSQNTTPPTVDITISPVSPTVNLGATQQFTATVTGSSNTSVTWSVSGGGTISTSGLYTAPASATTPVSVTVKATAQADTTKSASAAISIPAVSVTVSPSPSNTVLGATQQFIATVQNATDKSVTWSAAQAGTIDTAGLYTAPASLTTPASATVTATPAADPSKAVSVTVTIPAVSVTLNPGSAILTCSFKQKFAATVTNATDASVTWAMSGKGALDNTGQYTAPSTIASGDNATVTATSKADPTKSISAAVSLETISRTIAGYLVMPDMDFKSLTVNVTDATTGRLRPAGVKFLNADLFEMPQMVAAHPTKPFVYTPEGFVGILGYQLNANGSMMALPGSPFPAPNIRPVVTAITPNGKFLYVVNEYGGMWGWSIDQSTGVLTSIAGSPWTTGIDGEAMAIDAGSKHVYAMAAGNYVDASVGVFDIDPITGALTQVQTITTPGTGRASGMGLDPSGKFLYATGFDNGAIDGFKIDATTGQLTFIPGSPFTGSGYPGEGLAVDPLGKYVYAGNRGGIAMYTIDSTTGVLTEVSGSPFLTNFGEQGDIHPDVTGNFLYVNHNFTMTTASIDRVNNKLGFLNSIHSRTTVGTSRWVRFAAAQAMAAKSLTSKFAYVLNNADKTISAYSVDDTTGALTSLGTAVSTGGADPVAMTMDWYGNFLYVVNKGSNTISGFQIDQNTGALTQIPGSPFVTGPQPTGAAVETTGRVLFVGTAGDDSLTQYTLNPVTGALTAAGSTPTGQCTGDRRLITDWRGDYLYQVCAGTNKIASYTLQITTGLLSSMSPRSTVDYGGASFALSPYSAAPPHDPSSIWQSFGYLVSSADRQIKHFTVGNEGELTMMSAGPVGPDQGIALDPLGNFVYATNSTSNSVQGVAINPADGSLTEISGSPWSTGVFPIAAAMDTTGRFLYVVNRDSNTVSGFLLNFATGALIPMEGQTFAAGRKPVAMLVTGNMQ